MIHFFCCSSWRGEAHIITDDCVFLRGNRKCWQLATQKRMMRLVLVQFIRE